jgi:hypothetical protein
VKAGIQRKGAKRQGRNPIVLVLENLRIEDEDEDEKSSQNATMLGDSTAKRQGHNRRE